jgi:lysophospholipase L1-like esterase
MNDRRSFIKKAALGSLAAISIPEIVSAAMVKAGGKKIQLAKGQTILFQGDSITDAGRDKQADGYNTARILGTGYAMLAGASLLEKYATLDLKIYNKGISGNKVNDLAARWDKECIEIKPDVLSILIGVNDIWHTLMGRFNGTPGIYREGYTELLEKTKKALPNVKLIIGEPYGVKGVKAVDEKWYPQFLEYQKAARDLADQFGAVFIPYQAIYDEALSRAPGLYWTPDGVHASLAGAKLMAEAWMQTVK